MTKTFNSPDEVVADEQFQAWYFKESEKAVVAFETWLAAHPDQRPLVDQAIAFMQTIRLPEPAVSTEKISSAYERLSKTIGDTTPVVAMRSRRKWWIGAAAAVLLLVGAFAIWKLMPQKNSVNAQYGEICMKELPDGSTMLLNANSTARLGGEWKEDKDREVWLEGEAFFHVKKNPARNRFIVHTHQLDVIVTGTQFNVWTRDGKTSVLLTEGSVTIKTADGKETKMQPGDFVEISNTNLQKRQVNEESVLAWKDNKILFDKTPLSEVGRMITEHYGVKVTIVDSSINSLPINGMMENDNLDVLLRSLEATNDCKISRTENEIFISKPLN